MKAAILYGLVFITVFVNVTGVLIYFNTLYKNIFKFDFRLEDEFQKNSISAAELDTIKADYRQKIIDSLTTAGIIPTDEEEEDQQEPNGKNGAHSKKTKNGKKKEKEAETDKKSPKYLNWIAKTALLYEAMDPAQAAKIIEKYSDDIAKDIIYAMNKKKAAKILAELTPDVASRITRAK